MGALKLNWSKLVAFLDGFVPSAIKKYAPSLLLWIGIRANGFYLWITTVALKKAWKELEPCLAKLAYLWDRSAIDKKNIKELEKNETNGATSNEKIKDELDFLNGGEP